MTAEAVRVSLHEKRPLPRVGRADRYQLLRAFFDRLEPLILGEGGQLDRSSLSVSGQSIECFVPAESVDRLRAMLAREGVELDFVVEHDAEA